MEKMKKYFTIIVIAIVIIPFTFWGVYGYFDSTTLRQDEIGEIDGDSITLAQLQIEQNKVTNRIISANNGVLPDELQDSKTLETLAIASLLDQRLFAYGAKEFDVLISDSILENSIKSASAFKTGEKYDPNLLNSFLIENQLSVSQFTDLFREIMKKDTIATSITDTKIANTWEESLLVNLINEIRVIDIYFLAHSNFLSDSTPDLGALEAYYAENSTSFQTKESAIVNFITLSRDTLAGEVAPPDELALREYYETNFKGIETPGRRKASHILLTTESGLNEKEITSNLLEIKQSVTTLAEFEEQARILSEDIATRDQGGALDWIQPGDLDSNFEDALFSLTLDNPISEVVVSDFGYHLIYVTDIEEGSGSSYEVVRGQVEQAYALEAGNKIFDKQLSEIRSLLATNPVDVSAIESLVSATAVTSDILTPDEGTGIFDRKSLRDQVFSLARNADKKVSDIITLSPSVMLVFGVKKFTPVRTPPLEEVHASVTQAYNKQIATDTTKKVAEEIKIALNQRIPLSDLKHGARAQFVGDQEVYRLNPNLDLPDEMLDTLYQIPENQAGNKSYQSQILPTGDAMIYTLTSIKNSNPELIAQINSIEDPLEAINQLKDKENPSLEDTKLALTLRSFLVYFNGLTQTTINSLGDYFRIGAKVQLKPEYDPENKISQ